MQTQETCSGFSRMADAVWRQSGRNPHGYRLLWLALCGNGLLATAADMRLTIEPMQSGLASSLSIHADATADFHEYDRYLLTVASARRGKSSFGVPPGTAFEKRYWGQVGLEQGDQFQMEHGARITGGVLAAAPADVQAWIRNAMKVARDLAPVALGSGFLVSKRVDADRRRTMESRFGKIAGLEGLPLRVRETLHQASLKPGDFVALTNAQVRALQAARDWEYRIVGSSSLFQNTMYATRQRETKK